MYILFVLLNKVGVKSNGEFVGFLLKCFKLKNLKSVRKKWYLIKFSRKNCVKMASLIKNSIVAREFKFVNFFGDMLYIDYHCNCRTLLFASNDS